MPIFLYKAVTETSEIVEGEMEAPSQVAVIERLRSQGSLPLHARELSAGGHAVSGGSLFHFNRVSRRDVYLITHELATLLKAGVALDRAFEILIDLGENKSARDLLTRVLSHLRGGGSLADALAKQGNVFPGYYTSLIRAGEASGALDVVLERLTGFMEKSQKLRETVKTALYYPIFLLIMAVVSVVILLTVVVPQFKPMFDEAGAALPESTQILMASGDFIRDYGWLTLIVMALLALAIRRYLATNDGRLRWHSLLLKLPLLGTLLTKIEVARFSRTASTLLHNGVGLLNTFNIVRDTLTNSVIASSIDTVSLRLKEGRGLAEPLKATGLFPRLAVHLVGVGEETGQLEEMLSKVADIYDDEVGRTTARLMALLVPVLTIVMGLMVAGIIGSILTAILSVNNLAF
jgi:general secretion pathway protein F